MSMSANIHDVISAEAKRVKDTNWVSFETADWDRISMHLPRHVAEATAAAFTRAMQAVPDTSGGYNYATPSGGWHISLDSAMGAAWMFQSDEITGDGDPSWMHGSAKSLEAAMDKIDDIVAENICDECQCLAGLDNLIEAGTGRAMQMMCADCFTAWGESERDRHEAMGDDMAHAHAERNREAAE